MSCCKYNTGVGGSYTSTGSGTGCYGKGCGGGGGSGGYGGGGGKVNNEHIVDFTSWLINNFNFKVMFLDMVKGLPKKCTKLLYLLQSRKSDDLHVP